MQRYVILSCKLYCTTFTRSKGRSTSYDFNTYIAWHYATYPYMREYSILARNPCCSLFTRLFGLPLLHVNGGNNIKYNCIKPTHIWKGVVFYLVIFVVPLLWVMWLTPFPSSWGVPLIMTSSHTIHHTIYLYMQGCGILSHKLQCACFTRSWGIPIVMIVSHKLNHAIYLG